MGSFALLRMTTQKRLGSAADFGPPPADAYEEEAPVVEEFWCLAFEGVADELENPSEEKEKGGVEPEAMKEDARDEKHYRNQNAGNAQGVAGAIDGVLMAGGVLGDPLFIGAVAEHGWDHTPAISGARAADVLRNAIAARLKAAPFQIGVALFHTSISPVSPVQLGS